MPISSLGMHMWLHTVLQQAMPLCGQPAWCEHSCCISAMNSQSTVISMCIEFSLMFCGAWFQCVLSVANVLLAYTGLLMQESTLVLMECCHSSASRTMLRRSHDLTYSHNHDHYAGLKGEASHSVTIRCKAGIVTLCTGTYGKNLHTCMHEDCSPQLGLTCCASWPALAYEHTLARSRRNIRHMLLV